ncbi:MAG: RtcB family protein [Candidatus Delongbacteria bacterium]|nr:RtcB family protein [Candidatus Delongbacteria bacterium]
MKALKIERINDYSFTVARRDSMSVPVTIYADDRLLEMMQSDGAIEQACNVAGSLPGIYRHAIMCPDAHQGYGFPIGGVAAMDAEHGGITPGGIGFDINCGVRLMATNLERDQVESGMKPLLDQIFSSVPSGMGSESKLHLKDSELDEVLHDGARWAYRHGYGIQDDYILAEEGGCMPGADPDAVSVTARKRGRNQLGTLGAGNHFLEIQVVDQIYQPEIARCFGVIQPGQVMVSIHTGSRGLGHQVCSDYLKRMEDTYPDIMRRLPEKDLIYAPAQSVLAQQYFKAMSAAANFAWANRHIIAHWIRESFLKIWGSQAIITPVYDVAHNIAKLETHTIDGVSHQVYVHRKGATRSFPSGRLEIPDRYRSVGQPVLIPGSMGTASYLLVGTHQAMESSFGSTAHGAGRAMSRTQALKRFRGEQIKSELEAHHIHLRGASWKGIAEEAPSAYKDIDRVIAVTQKAGLADPIARLTPIGVVKG